MILGIFTQNHFTCHLSFILNSVSLHLHFTLITLLCYQIISPLPSFSSFAMSVSSSHSCYLTTYISLSLVLHLTTVLLLLLLGSFQSCYHLFSPTSSPNHVCIPVITYPPFTTSIHQPYPISTVITLFPIFFQRIIINPSSSLIKFMPFLTFLHSPSSLQKLLSTHIPCSSLSRYTLLRVLRILRVHPDSTSPIFSLFFFI